MWGGGPAGKGGLGWERGPAPTTVLLTRQGLWGQEEEESCFSVWGAPEAQKNNFRFFKCYSWFLTSRCENWH